MSETQELNYSKIMLVTTKKCPNCDTAKNFMNDANILYDIVEAEANPELVSQYAVRSAPTLVVVNGKGYETITNISNIRAFVESH